MGFLYTMFSISEIFYLVFTQLAVGGLIVLLLIPKGLVDANFYRLMAGIYLLVGVLARCTNLYLHQQTVSISNFFSYWGDTEAVLIIAFVLLLSAYTLSWWFKSPVITILLFYSGFVCGFGLIVVSALPYLADVNFPGASFLLPFQFLISAILLGIVHSGMWFGHWYLVTPDLPVKYLRRFNSVLLYTLIVAISLFSLNLYFRSQVEASTPFNFHFQLIFFIRLGIGYAGSLLLYFITWDCLRTKYVERDEMGATRAATGFLFIAIITVFMGEICSRYLFLTMKFML